MKRWKAIFLELMEWGVDPGSTPGEQKHVRYTNAASILALLLTILFFVFETPIIADWGTLGPREALILGFRFAASFLFIIPPLLNRRGLPSASRLFFGVCAVLFTIGLTWLYGSAAPSHLFFIAIVAAFIAIFPARERVTMWFILGLCLAGFGLSLFLRYSAQPLVTIQRPEIRIVVDVMVSLGAIALVPALSLAQRSANDAAEAAVVAQREKADRLLLNILPEPIAERLKANPGAIADGFDEVTVMLTA